MIEALTGTIRTAVPLDRETIDMYTLTVIAKDAGTPSLSTNVTVFINVSDVNDNMPQFSLEHYTVSLVENEESMNFLNLMVQQQIMLNQNIIIILSLSLSSSLLLSSFSSSSHYHHHSHHHLIIIITMIIIIIIIITIIILIIITLS